jgi:spermidine/putrescine transport system ATP-binding protein
MPLIIEKLSKSFGKTPILKNVSFEVGEGEFFSILGKSGSGKTTLIRLIAGLEQADSGKIYLNGKDITRLAPHERKTAMVFQNYALFPHLNVYENAAFGLREQKKSEQDIKTVVLHTLKLLAIDEKMYRSTADLSGGEQQRVAIARALAAGSVVTLFDEPLSNLDVVLRKSMQRELKQIQQKTGHSFIYITHDQEEALMLSDKMIVIDGGSVCEFGKPEEIYHRPKTLFGASFIGSANVVAFVKLDKTLMKTETGLVLKHTESVLGKFYDVVIRPEHIEPVKQVGENVFKAKLKSRLFKGAYFEYVIDVEGTEMVMFSPEDLKHESLVWIKKFFIFLRE